MSSWRSTASATVGRAASSSEVQRQAAGVTSITGLRPRLSERPPKKGETTKDSAPEAEEVSACARACAAGSAA